jgi:hypothetical protein
VAIFRSVSRLVIVGAVMPCRASCASNHARTVAGSILGPSGAVPGPLTLPGPYGAAVGLLWGFLALVLVWHTASFCQRRQNHRRELFRGIPSPPASVGLLGPGPSQLSTSILPVLGTTNGQTDGA